MSFIQFVIPGRPVPKGRPRFSTRNGTIRTYTPEPTRKAEEFVRACVNNAARDFVKAFGLPGDGSASVFIDIQFMFEPPASWSKKNRHAAIAGHIKPTGKPDLDNLVKLVTDAMNGILYKDDAQIVRIKAMKTYANQSETVVQVSI